MQLSHLLRKSTQLTIDRYIGQLLVSNRLTIGRQLTDSRPTVNQQIDRQSTNASLDITHLSVDHQSTIDRQSTDYWLIVDQQSTDILTDCRPMHQLKCANLSVDCWSIYWSRSISQLSTDSRSTVDMATETTYSTHDPVIQ